MVCRQERDAPDRLEVQLQRTERLLGTIESRSGSLIVHDVQLVEERISFGPGRELDPELSQFPTEVLELLPCQLNAFEPADDLLVSKKALLACQGDEPAQFVCVVWERVARCHP